MIPRRHIVQAGLRAQSSAASSRAIRSAISNGRQFGTARSSMNAGLLSSSGLRIKASAPTLTLGALTSSRSLSLWGSGSSKTPTPPAETSPDASKIVELPPASATPSLSTSTAPGAPPAISPAADLTTAAPADNDMSHITDLISQHENILNLPETIGYLKDMGLDYGWGPTSIVQWFLEHIHVYTGLGWGGSIIAAAVAIRVAFFWPQVLNMRNSVRMSKMRQDPRFTEAQQMLTEGSQTRNITQMNKARFVQKKLSEEYGTSLMAVAWGLLPVPFSYGMFRLINGMSSLPVPSFEHSGYLWFTDLASTDPYYILPFASVGMMVAGMKVMQKQAPGDQRKMMNTMMYGIGGIMSVAGLWFTAGIHLMGIAFGGATLVQAIILSNPVIRRMLNIPTLIPPPKAATPTEATYEPPRSLREKMTKMSEEGQQSIEKLTTQFTGKAPETAKDKAVRAKKEKIAAFEKKRREQEEEEFNRKYRR